MGRFIKNLLILAIISFLFHMPWEYFQWDIFYIMVDSESFVSFLGGGILRNVIISIVLYILLAIVSFNIDWIIEPWGSKTYFIILLYGLLLGFYFEVYNVYIKGLEYTEAMPILPITQIGAVPILQLLFLLPLSLMISKQIIMLTTKRKKYYFS